MVNLPVYLDHAATTPIAPEVLDAMLPFLGGRFGNPSSLHSAGADAREAVEEAREAIAAEIGAFAEEIAFTSGGTEADNWAVKGVAAAAAEGKRHVLVSAVEHHAVLDAAGSLSSLGFDVERISVDGLGRVCPSDVENRIRPDTALVSVMYANNEVGTVQPVAQIGRICRARGVPFHCDAVQALGQLDIDVNDLCVDLLTLSAHKAYGPKGTGVLYVRRGVKVAPLLNGGGQERALRGGTHNVAGIVGMHAAVRECVPRMLRGRLGVQALRDRLIDSMWSAVPDSALCGDRAERLPNNAHFCFPGVEAEALLLALDADGVCASAGSACSSGSTEASHVLLAMGLAPEAARGALRLTLGCGTTANDIDYAVERVAVAVRELRDLRRV